MHTMDTVTIEHESALEPLARMVLAALPKQDGASVVTLQGDLGAGKTAFTKALARVLGITEHITSPTFVIMKSYPITGHERFTTLTHIDAYRIDDIDELRVLGFESLLADPARLVVIEWPERIPSALPEHVYAIRFIVEQDGTRTITYGNT